MMKLFFSALLISIAGFAAASSNLPALNSKAPVEISADSLEVLQKDQVALFSGNVEAVQANTKIQSNEMKVYYGKPETQTNPNAPSISKIEVTGNVRIRTAAEIATGSKGVYDVSKGQVTLTGNVSLTKDKNIIRGGSLLIDLNNGYSKIINNGSSSGGRVRGLFTPQ